jgi:glycosyltransferase involved in cell wall biosynthesis
MESKNKRILISVLMTAYNREKYISEAIESVLASDFHDFELIIVDDCSIDNTVEIAKKYEIQDSRVKVYINDKNLGDYQNRNKAASYAKGKYIKYVDADDYIYPNGLETIATQMELYPYVGLGFFSLPQNINKPFPIVLNPNESYEYNFFGPGLFYKAPLSSIINREIFIKEGGFKPIRHCGDFELWHRLSQKYSTLLIQDHIVWFREHDNQESKKHNNNVELEYTRIEYNYILDPRTPFSNLQRNKIIFNKIRYNLKNSLVYLFKLKFNYSYLFFNKILIFLNWKK